MIYVCLALFLCLFSSVGFADNKNLNNLLSEYQRLRTEGNIYIASNGDDQTNGQDRRDILIDSYCGAVCGSTVYSFGEVFQAWSIATNSTGFRQIGTEAQGLANAG